MAEWLTDINKKCEALIKKMGLQALDANQSLKVVKQTLGIPPSFGAFLLIVLLIFLVSILFADNLVVMIFGFFIPSYSSFLALESPSKDDDKKWLTYWVVFILLQALISPIMVFTMKPTYATLFKLGLIFCLLSSKTEGAKKLYELIAGCIRKHEGKIEQIYEKSKQKMYSAGNTAYDTYTKMN